MAHEYTFRFGEIDQAELQKQMELKFPGIKIKTHRDENGRWIVRAKRTDAPRDEVWQALDAFLFGAKSLAVRPEPNAAPFIEIEEESSGAGQPDELSRQASPDAAPEDVIFEDKPQEKNMDIAQKMQDIGRAFDEALADVNRTKKAFDEEMAAKRAEAEKKFGEFQVLMDTKMSDYQRLIDEKFSQFVEMVQELRATTKDELRTVATKSDLDAHLAAHEKAIAAYKQK